MSIHENNPLERFAQGMGFSEAFRFKHNQHTFVGDDELRELHERVTRRPARSGRPTVKREQKQGPPGQDVLATKAREAGSALDHEMVGSKPRLPVNGTVYERKTA